MPAIAALFCGMIFGFGLLISGMMQPAKVLAFLDIFGMWDPSLAVVMVAALAVCVPGFALAKRRERPLLAAHCNWPTKIEVDRPLVVGSLMFGVGWGLVGLCPGAGVGEPCYPVATGHRLCGRNGSRHGGIRPPADASSADSESRKTGIRG